MQTKHLTIMFTDMKGFTSRTSVHTREELEELLDQQEKTIRPIFDKFDGRVVKTIGDAFMVVFESPTNAVLCGVKIQEELLKYNEGVDEKNRIEIRIGINSGEVNIKGDDYFGEPVNIASRIESISEPNEVYFSDSVYLSMNKNEIPSAEVGVRHLKGIPDNIKVYRVLREKEEIEKIRNLRKDLAIQSNKFSKSGGENIKEEKQKTSYFKTVLYGIGGLIIFIFLGIIFMWIFKICPPQGEWMMPPWCAISEKTSVSVDEKAEDVKINGDMPTKTDVEKLMKNVRKAILAGEIKPAKEGLDELVKILIKLGGDPELEKTINELKNLFTEKFAGEIGPK